MMNEFDQLFIQSEKQMERYKLVSELSVLVKENASTHDKEGSIPIDSFQKLKESGYTTFTVPKEYGGLGISLYELVLYQEKLAQGDSSIALSIGWHLGILQDLSEKKHWEKSIMHQIFTEVVDKKVLINTLASEAQTGSPARGGLPGTIAKRVNGSWLLNGRKTFATMVEILDYYIITANIDDSDNIAHFMVPRGTSGIEIIHTWKTISMRGTGSHDVIIRNVKIPEEYLLFENNQPKSKANGWLLHIPACYMGIAIAARNDAIEFATNYTPNSIKGPIKNIPSVQTKLGEIDLQILSARHFMYSIAQKWDDHPNMRESLIPELAAVKNIVTNTAIDVVDKAMRIVGGHSLYLNNPLQKYYRDVRAGLHNPPADEAAIGLLAQRALEQK
jgi:alkylation response protein AidB-like acyl-CoA dehydrogenase